jgi:hypothetical protein
MESGEANESLSQSGENNESLREIILQLTSQLQREKKLNSILLARNKELEDKLPFASIFYALKTLVLKCEEMEGEINSVLLEQTFTPGGSYAGPTWSKEMNAAHALLDRGLTSSYCTGQQLVQVSCRLLSKLSVIGRLADGAIWMVYYRRGQQYRGPNWGLEVSDLKQQLRAPHVAALTAPWLKAEEEREEDARRREDRCIVRKSKFDQTVTILPPWELDFSCSFDIIAFAHRQLEHLLELERTFRRHYVEKFKCRCEPELCPCNGPPKPNQRLRKLLLNWK